MLNEVTPRDFGDCQLCLAPFEITEGQKTSLHQLVPKVRNGAVRAVHVVDGQWRGLPRIGSTNASPLKTSWHDSWPFCSGMAK